MAPDSGEDAVRRFITGGLVAFALALVLPSAVRAVQHVLPVPRMLAPVMWNIPVPLSLGLGGLIAGAALDRGGRGRVAIALAMLSASVIQILTLGDAGRLTGRENPVFVVTFELAVSAGAFAVSGVCAGRLLGMRAGELSKLAAGFAVGGFLCGVASVATYFLARFGAGAMLGRGYLLVLLLLQALSILGPFVASGVVFARVLGNRPT